MCTVTWRRSGAAYDVFFNRDEKRTRAPALAPRLSGTAPRRFLAPVDGHAGGAWLAVNEAGLTVGILNYYDRQRAPPPRTPRSRGHLVLDQMAHARAVDVRDALAKADVKAYPSFLLLAFDPVAGWLMRWDGILLRSERLADDARPVSTSSFDTGEVLRERRARYQELVGAGEPDPDRLERFHRDTIPRGGAYSVWMDRPDAWTVSFSRVQVEPGGIRYHYQSRDAEAPIVLSLPRFA